MKILVLVEEDLIKNIEYETIDKYYMLKKKLCSDSHSENLSDYDKEDIVRVAIEALNKGCGIDINIALGRDNNTDERTYSLESVEISPSNRCDIPFKELNDIFSSPEVGFIKKDNEDLSFEF